MHAPALALVTQSVLARGPDTLGDMNAAMSLPVRTRTPNPNGALQTAGAVWGAGRFYSNGRAIP